MFDHISIGVADLARAETFYDAALTPLGLTRLYKDADAVAYGSTAPRWWALRASAPVAADPNSGLHFCFTAPSRASVDAFHQAALANGGGDNGAPGLREAYGPNYYAAFVIDPDGYRIEAYCSEA